MPRTTTLDCPGCPSLRALTFDVLGLIKVVEARNKDSGSAKVVERWGDPDSSKCVLAASIDNSLPEPSLAVARKNGMIDFLNPMNGDTRFSISHVGDADTSPEDDPFIALHLLKKQRLDSSSRSRTLLACTSKGTASLRTVKVPKSPTDSVKISSHKAWQVCGSGSIFCCKVDASENYTLFAGKGVEVNMWDLETSQKIWNAKSPRKDSLGIFAPTWFQSATYLNNDDHRKFVAGTNNHQVRLYDISAQRRPVLSIDFRETPIKAIAEDLDGHTIYFGNGFGDLASVDIRTGKLLGSFIGKCSGSIRSIARHPELPVIASCGLDGYVRFWDVKSRQLLSAVFLKQPLSSVVFDTNFVDATGAVEAAADAPPDDVDEDDEPDEEEARVPAKRKESSEVSNGKKKKRKSKKTRDQNEEAGVPSKRKEPSDESNGKKKKKRKQKSKKTREQTNEDEDA